MTETTKRGMDLLHDSRLNKGTGFTAAEREALGLTGLVPEVTETLETQLSRVMEQLAKKATDLDRFIYLMSLLDSNETLFYRTLMSDPARFLEIVYDPTIGEACLKFDHILRRPLGMYLAITHKGKVKEVLRNWPEKDVRFICVTNGGRILGLGDLGANGMGIPIGKLQLYTATAGVPPQGLLPIYLDAGTNNEPYLADPLYVGLRQHRPSTEELYAFVDEFVEAVQEVFPHCCIHFEDWTGVDAINLLARYREKVCCYNDDIQGTAGVTLAGLINALKLTGGELKDQRILFLGAGSAAIGLANLMVSALGQQGIPAEVARQQIRMFDTQGLVVTGRPGLPDHKKPYAKDLPPSQPFEPGERMPPHRRGDRRLQAHRPDRCEHRGQAVQPGGGGGDGSPQRPADHLPPLQSHREDGMPGRRGLPLEQGKGGVCGRRPTAHSASRRPHLPALAGQQPLHLPRRGPGHPGHQRQGGHR
jgi:malate dehydrogenase (oxaloacetate-decarboxylating)(NADP+)